VVVSIEHPEVAVEGEMLVPIGPHDEAARLAAVFAERGG
jgi:hypothetical protein